MATSRVGPLSVLLALALPACESGFHAEAIVVRAGGMTPVRGAHARLVCPLGHGPAHLATDTDAQGHFSFEAFGGATECTIEITGDGFAPRHLAIKDVCYQSDWAPCKAPPTVALTAAAH